MDLTWTAYLWAFSLSLIAAFGLTPLALRIAQRFGALDQPGAYKTQDSPVPYLGGVAMVVAFAGVIVIGSFLRAPPSGANQLALVVGVGVGLSMVGLLDDLRGLHPLPRFALQLAAAIAVWTAGISIELFHQPAADAVLTVIWIVGITNAFNLLDNMDGLSAGLAAIASGFFFLLGALNGQIAVAALAAALAGCSLGFLRHNFHPARIYMGDAGSLFLGFLLAVIGVKLSFPAPKEIAFMVPVLVLGVAIFDTSVVVINRLFHRLSPFAGGRDHISHRLVFVGVPVRSAVALVYAAGIGLGWLAVVMSRLDTATGFILMGFAAAVSIFAGVMLGRVPVYEHSRRRRVMLMEVVPHEERSQPAVTSPPDGDDVKHVNAAEAT